MTSSLKYPIAIFIVWHPRFPQGKFIAEKIYSTFCRDIDAPLTRGIGVPVYYRCHSYEGMPLPIDTSLAVRNVIVLLIDQKYFTDVNFRSYTLDIVELVSSNTRIYPVALFSDANSIGCGLNSFQFIRAYSRNLPGSEDDSFDLQKIVTALLHDCARLLMNFQESWLDKNGENKNSPIQLFLSHAKRDGLDRAIRFKQFVESELKLDVFFDAVDIADGYEFENQIEESIKKSALIVFHTDEYSDREWCRIEVLIAKRNKCSMVVVHDIKKGERRAFPYLGNTPTLAIQDDEIKSFYEIVNATLYQVINNLYQIELLEEFCKLYPIADADYLAISSPPELFNFVDIYKKKVEGVKKIIVLYPDPPLGTEEIRLLNELDQNIKFITPILLPTL